VRTLPALKSCRTRTKAEKKLLAQGKTCDRLRLVLGTCFSVSGDCTGFQVRKVKDLAWGVLAQWVSFF
jgi:hypothetical protein